MNVITAGRRFSSFAVAFALNEDPRKEKWVFSVGDGNREGRRNIYSVAAEKSRRRPAAFPRSFLSSLPKGISPPLSFSFFFLASLLCVFHDGTGK